MNIVEKTITPDMAYKMLEANTHNRTLRQSVVERYARDMKAGKWLFTHEAIAFDFEKTLVDGQHRLWAVIESATPTKFTVAYDVRPETRGVINAGLVRDVTDQLNLGHAMKVSRLFVAIAKRLIRDQLPGKATTAEVMAAIGLHTKAIEFSEQVFTRVVRGITTVPVHAVIARAVYHADADMLRHFAEVLQDGRSVDATDDPVIMLRTYLLERAPRSGGEAQIYAKAERALFAFLHHERVSILYPAPNELFPLPEERTAKKRLRAGAPTNQVLNTVKVGKKLSSGRPRKTVH